MSKLINIVSPGEPIPSLNDQINNYDQDLYEIERSDGLIYRLYKSQYESKIAKADNNANKPPVHRKIDPHKYSKMRTGHHNYWEFIRYLSKHSKICGFQCTEDKEDQLKMDYFNATGEELRKDQYNADLSLETWGNAMRVSFPKPYNMSIEDINDLLPGDVEAKRWADNPNELVISRMELVRELLYMGFRHGKDHKIENIEETIKKFQKKDGY